MSAAQPHRARPRPATPVPCARRQPTRRPRQWSRLLAPGLALVLVAALMPGAPAEGEGGDGGGVPISAETLGDETSLQTSEADTMAERLEDQTPAAAPKGADGSGDGIVLADGGEATGRGGLPLERPQQDSVPPVVAEHRQERQPPGVQQSEVGTDDPLNEAEHLVQRFDAGQGGGAAGAAPGETPTVAPPDHPAAAGHAGRGVDIMLAPHEVYLAIGGVDTP